MESRNPPEVNKQLNEEKQSMVSLFGTAFLYGKFASEERTHRLKRTCKHMIYLHE